MMHLEELISVMEIPPIARSILSRSLPELDRCILHDPMAPMRRVMGIATLQISATWPQGLRRLLATEARSLLNVSEFPASENDYCTDLSPIYTALKEDCLESVGLLMNAGCQFCFDWERWEYTPDLSHECAAVLASHLAKRRQALLRIAQRRLGIYLSYSPLDVADGIAAQLSSTIWNARIPISPCLIVEPDYATIYHKHQLPIKLFPIFFEKGFWHTKSHDNMGLTPVMVWRAPFWPGKQFSLGQPSETLTWLNN
ncbi:hypothetical protein B0H67DRAFT_214048 [Lasiosphaeris hirsuta]|uniref:Uncharacterized protein n=1 Tax=Lasiosphaeris hirsuta TaxID=260670 RepID=A0AA40AET4_9PEZI|nr:hypothetical protein B0H67DRAFT_214048 [Lasiosphaeris hirsuta]